jgi:hypothetical protein
MSEYGNYPLTASSTHQVDNYTRLDSPYSYSQVGHIPHSFSRRSNYHHASPSSFRFQFVMLLHFQLRSDTTSDHFSEFKQEM